MAYSIFLSYSTQDLKTVEALVNQLEERGFKVFAAEWCPSPGKLLVEKIFPEIEEADCMVVLLTKNGARSSWVHQEVGYAMKANKLLISLVEEGVDSKDLGALQGREYIPYDLLQPQEALDKVEAYVEELKLKLKKEKQDIIFIGGIITFLLLLLGKKN